MSTDTKASEIFSEPCSKSAAQKLGQYNQKIYEDIIAQLKNVLKTLVEQAAQLEARHKDQIKELQSRLADKDYEILRLSQSKQSLLMNLQKFYQRGCEGIKKSESRIQGVNMCDSIQLSQSSKKSAEFNRNKSTPFLTDFNHNLTQTQLNSQSHFSKICKHSNKSSNVKDSIAYNFQSQSNDSFASKIVTVPIYFGKKVNQESQSKQRQKLNQELKIIIDSGAHDQQIGDKIKEDKQLNSQSKLFMLNNLSKQILNRIKQQFSNNQNIQSQVQENQDFYDNKIYQKQKCKQRNLCNINNNSTDTPNFAKYYCAQQSKVVKDFNADRLKKIQSNLNILNQSIEENKNFGFTSNQISKLVKESKQNSLFSYEIPLNKTVDQAFKVSELTDIQFHSNAHEYCSSNKKKKINLKNSSSKKVNVINGKYVLKSPMTNQSKDLFNAKSFRNESGKKSRQTPGCYGKYSSRKSSKKSNTYKISNDAKERLFKQNNRNVVNSKQRVLQNHDYYIRSQRKNNNSNKKDGSQGNHFRTQSNEGLSSGQLQLIRIASNQQLKLNEVSSATKKMIRLQREKGSKSKSPRKNYKKLEAKEKQYYQMNYKFKIPKISNFSEVTSSSYLKQMSCISNKLHKSGTKNTRTGQVKKQKEALQMSQSQISLGSINKIEQQSLKYDSLNGRSSLPIMKRFYNNQYSDLLCNKEKLGQLSIEKIESQQSSQKIQDQLNYSLKNGHFLQSNNTRQSLPINSVKNMTNIVPVRQITMKNAFH